MNVVQPQPAYWPCIVVLMAALQSGTLLAQGQNFEGKKVVNVRFDPPAQPLEGAELFQRLTVKRDEPLRMNDVRASIDRLFATGRYADIQVEADPYNDGVIVTFRTQNSWFIGNVSVSGKISDPPNVGQLANATRLELGQPFSFRQLAEATAGQKHLQESDGLFLGSSQPVFIYDEAHQQINIRFEVTSGKRAHFGPPSITGDLKMENFLLGIQREKWPSGPFSSYLV
jgi:outer membrane protein assembly factor BamA